MIGELGVTGPQRFGPDTVLQSFSGFGGVNGYLGLLQQSQQIRNTEENLRLQLRTLDRLEALYENELIDIVQVDQFRQNIEATRANLLDQTNGLELAIDNYKTQILGLPPDLPVDLDEQLIKQFQLIPPASASLLESLLELQQRIGVIGELSDLQSRLEFLDRQLPNLPQQDLVDADLTLRRFNGLVESAGRRLRDLPNALDQLQDRHEAFFQEPFFDDLDESQRETLAKIRTLAREDMEQLSQQFLDATLRLDELLDNLSEDNLVATVAANSDWFSEILALSHAIVLIQSAANDLPSEPQRALADAEQLIEPVRELFAEARADLERLQEVAADRERSMGEEEKLRFRQDREKLNERLEDLESGDSGLQLSVDELNQLRDFYSLENRDQTIRGLTAWIQSYLQLVERLALVPAQARLEVIAVEQVELEPEAAFQIALQNRLDFMNGRAALVDRWRAIQVAADALQSDLSITGGGDVRTAKNNPVDFRAATSTLRLGIEFDAPLARLLERNGYRESLIEFQRNRRNLIQSEDALQKGLRALLRTLRQRKLQLEIQRRAVTIALRRVDQTQLSLLTPPPQGQPGVRPQINPTTAINLLGAQSSLQTSQNSFLAAWLDYYAARLRLFRELGVMQLDSSGRWIENSIDFGADEPAGPPESLPPAAPVDAQELDVSDPFRELGLQVKSASEMPAIMIQPVGTDRLGTQWSARPVVSSRQKTGKKQGQ
ncbi:MAG: hypothetical protein F9B45_00260 [Phycisphaera sp. RhM]|nr:hypothetical protein [Phycisphaera sp. RhM]